jgi:hypothetical protein
MHRFPIRPIAACALAAALSYGALATAAPISTERAIAEGAAPAAAGDRERVKQFFERDDVRGRIQALGVAPELAFKRVDSLTDAEVRQLAAKIDSLPAGGDIGKNTLILILVLVLLLALI